MAKGINSALAARFFDFGGLNLIMEENLFV